MVKEQVDLMAKLYQCYLDSHERREKTLEIRREIQGRLKVSALRECKLVRI